MNNAASPDVSHSHHRNTLFWAVLDISEKESHGLGEAVLFTVPLRTINGCQGFGWIGAGAD
jgi:hypothetical protein